MLLFRLIVPPWYLRFCLSLLIFLSTLSCSSATEVSIKFTNPGKQESPQVIMAELAYTAKSRQTGLMWRKQLDPNQGMLFIFPDEGPRSFWMKNTYLELDMIFINSSFQVVHIIRKAMPLTEKARVCKKPAKYVLEIGGGLAKKWGIIVGSRAEISGKIPQVE